MVCLLLYLAIQTGGHADDANGADKHGFVRQFGRNLLLLVTLPISVAVPISIAISPAARVNPVQDERHVV